MSFSSIKILFRSPDTLTLWGIPYEMRPGQSPGDLWRSNSHPDTLAQARGIYGGRGEQSSPSRGPRVCPWA